MIKSEEEMKTQKIQIFLKLIIDSSVVYVHNEYCTFISLGMEERKRGGDES